MKELWKAKTDDQIIEAMKDLKGFHPEARLVIQSEFKERGLTLRRTHKEEVEAKRKETARQIFDKVYKYIYPKELPAVLRLIGVTCFLSVVLSFDSIADSIGWSIEHSDSSSILLALFSILVTGWALLATFFSFKPSSFGWSVITSFAAFQAGSSVTAFNVSLIFSASAEKSLYSMVSFGVWTAILFKMYRPQTLTYMDVTDQRFTSTRKLSAWILFIVIVLPIMWFILLF